MEYDEWPSPADFQVQLHDRPRLRERTTFPQDDPRHGTANGYINLGCRCDDCREGWRLYEPSRLARERYRRRLGMKPAKRGREHGIRATYVHGCRCGECREAERLYRSAYRRRA